MDGFETEPTIIQTMLADQSDAHFKLPDSSHPIAKKIQSDPNLWQALREGLTKISDLPEAVGIPKDLVDLFDAAVTHHQNNTPLQQELQAALYTPFHYEQFTNTISKKKSGKSPGITNYSINIMKCWPDNIRRRVFDILNELWKIKHIPAFWKDRCIPKSNITDDITQLRPIALYEVTRKIWTAMVLSKIHPILRKHKILQRTQNGFEPDRAVDTALLQLINVIEEAIELITPLYYTSWDFKTSFDSPTKNPNLPAHISCRNGYHSIFKSYPTKQMGNVLAGH
jgi:hypothetical protein